MDPPDLRHLYEEGTRCTVCQGGFYGSERVSFFPECSVPHYLHHQCLTRSFLILGVEKTYRCPQCLQQRSLVSTVNMPSDLPHRSTMGDSPPEDHPSPPPSPPPPPQPPPPLPSPPPKFAPGTSILDAGEFIPQTSYFLEEPKSEVLAPDGSLPNDVSARYCNHCGVFLNSSAWSRFYDHVFCHRCSLQLTFYDTNVSFLEEGAEGEEGDEEEDGDEEMTIVDANEGAYGDEEMTILDANERAYGDEELMADLDADEEEEDGADSEDDGETAAGEEEKEDDADTEDDEEEDDDTSGENG